MIQKNKIGWINLSQGSISSELLEIILVEDPKYPNIPHLETCMTRCIVIVLFEYWKRYAHERRNIHNTNNSQLKKVKNL